MTQQHLLVSEKSKILCETTVNIDIEVYRKLTEAAKQRGISRSRLIAMLLEHLVWSENIPSKARGTVQHQDARPKENWKKLHVVLPNYVHDFFDDVRKLWKMSVSYLVAFAVEKFLTQLDNNMMETFADKYWYGGHTIVHFIQNDLQYMLCCWGIPSHPPEIPPFSAV